MNKKVLIILGFLVLIPFVSAEDISVIPINKQIVIIPGYNDHASYELRILSNLEESDNAEIYSLVGVSLSPKGTFEVERGVTRIDVDAYPNKEILKNQRGTFAFEYQLRGQEFGIYKGKLVMKILDLGNVFLIRGDNILPGEEEAVIKIKNLNDIKLESVRADIFSEFFKTSEVLSFEPYEEILIRTKVDGLNELYAGGYEINVDFEFEDVKGSGLGFIDYLEKEGTSVREDSSGIILRKLVINKTNVGNTEIPVKTEMTRNILNRLFTSYTGNPIIERNGLRVSYVWEQSVPPGESFESGLTTNYTFPFLILLAVVVGVVGVRYYNSKKGIALTKRVSYVRTKGGEFALKVRLHVKANKELGNVKLIDKIPEMAKLYEKYGKKPDAIDEATRRLMWKVGHLNPGEERVFSYVIYSKLNVVGQFELPLASISFDSEGKKEIANSNKTYFVAETTTTEME